jgi:hypothetical protein
LPPDVKLVSLNQIQHAFAFHYGRPIPVVPWPTPESPLPDDVDYFCVQVYRDGTFSPTFAWDVIDTISCDRFHGPVVEDLLIVGRRRRELTASHQNDNMGPAMR